MRDDTTALTPDAFRTVDARSAPTETAPDGSAVTKLATMAGGSVARFRLAAGQVSQAVKHQSVDEIWYVIAGRGEMWRKLRDHQQLVPMEPGICLTIPAGTSFQFRAAADAELVAVAITMPPWPGADEAVCVDGPWRGAAQ